MEEFCCSCSPCIPNAKEDSLSNRRTWTKEEDERLIKYIKAHGPWGWLNIPKATGIRRSSTSCRGRWLNHLRPEIKHEKFTKEEEEKIIKLHNTVGNRWSIMARHLPQRSASDIRNYWRFVIMKKYFRGEIDGNLINPNMPTVCDRNLSVVLKNNKEMNKAAGTSTQNHQMNMDQQLNLELTLSPPGA